MFTYYVDVSLYIMTSLCVIVTLTCCKIRGANLDSACQRMFRPLHRAVAVGDPSIVQTLLTMGAAPNEVDINR